MPGLNPAIRAVTIRALREGYQVIGLRRGWAGVMEIRREKDADNSNCYTVLTEQIVNKAGRTGGTFLHTSRTNPSKVKKADIPEHLSSKYNKEINDVTPEVIEPFFDKRIPGIMEHIRLKYGAEKPGALLSRSVAGVAGTTLIFALPGSVKAVNEYMAEILRVLEHLLFAVRGIDRHE